MGALRKLWLRFGWWQPVTWSLRHYLSQSRKDVNKRLQNTQPTWAEKHSLRPTGESSNSHTITLLSSSSITPGRATGSVNDRTHVRLLARQKSKWTMGGCGALRRCGCATTYKGTQFLCVKFRLGSAGERTICSHCYDVLNEDYSINSLTRGKFEWNFIYVIFKRILVIDGWGISCECHFTDDQSTMVWVMAWCRQATSHYLSQCWPRSHSPYGVTPFLYWTKNIPACWFPDCRQCPVISWPCSHHCKHNWGHCLKISQKSCRSSCLESQIRDIKLKKN